MRSFPLAIPTPGFLLAITIAHSPAFTLRVDLDSGGNTLAGWESLSASDNALGDSWSRGFVGGIGVDIDAIGSVSLAERDRGASNGGNSENAMWRDFAFADGSFNSRPESGLRVSITGLTPHTTYPIRLWAWDDSSNGDRRADWSGGGAGPVTLHFPSSPDPSSLQDYSITLDCTTNGEGALELVGMVAAEDPSSSHNVFLNGLEVGNPSSTDGPTGISLSNTTIGKTTPVGSLVGVLASIDPTPDDQFTYALVGGAGSNDNGQFAIVGNRLETDRDLSGMDGPLSVRIRNTDAGNQWVEAVFSIHLSDDTDLDGLSDDWELSFFPNLDATTGSADHDADGLDNLGEQARGTNPLLPDTDHDGLDDNIENGSGFFVDATNPGSNPLLEDTDGDGIRDSEEVSAANGSITNPNLADSDRDGFSDPLEIAADTDPVDPVDFPDTALPLRINEILTRNDTGIDDGFGTREDWIEIYNPNPTELDLEGYFLTDNPALPTKWSFPPVSIPANGYLVVFASGADLVDPEGNPHTNFRLSAAGEYLALVRPDGTTIDDSFGPSFPEQFTDISYGSHPVDGSLLFYDLPTPGSANSTDGYPGVVKDTNFSVDRGFHDSPFLLTITSATPGATIRYTTDGSKPSTTRGTIFNPASPIEISTTRTIRAVAYRSGWLPTNVDTHTYLFLEDVAQQPSNPRGWPRDWGYDSEVGGTVPSDYEMDPRVVENANGRGVHSIEDALLDIPTVAISMKQDDFTGSSAGIYTHPRSRWERECAVEYIHPDGTPGFQEDCKIEVHGNSSRRPMRMQKHSLRLTFTSSIGTPKLRYPLFADSDVEEFNKLVLRACFTDSWGLASWSSARYRPNDSQYIRDVWMKDSMKAMGHPSSHGNFVHLYVNGLYFGLHNLTERIEDDFLADHLGGRREDWLINEDLSSPPARWQTLMNIVNGPISGNTTYRQAQNYLDVANFADYMLLHFYADAEDWPHHNGYAAANADSGDGKFRFFVWDQEIVLDKFSWANGNPGASGNRYNDTRGAGALFQRLRRNEEFRMLFADRVQKHLFNDGALNEENSIARYLARANQIDKAIVAESARWGDVQATTPYGNTPGSSNNIDADYFPPTINSPIYFTREQHWVVERNTVVRHYIPTLHDPSDSRSFIRELRNNSLFPSIDAPVLAQHGGVVPDNHELTISAPGAVIYLTLDGSDPRTSRGLPSGNSTMIASGESVLLSETAMVRARSFHNDEWSALTEASFIVGQPASSANLAVSELYYNPPGADEGTEFIELMNTDPTSSIDLTNVSLQGVDYTFPAGIVLSPGERMVIARNRTAFTAAHPLESEHLAPGEYGGSSLSNEGEEIVVLAQDGITEIRRFTYDDKAPWPLSADGAGYSLVLIAPEENPDHGEPFNWRPSTGLAGNPGGSDRAPAFVGSPDLDADLDGFSAFFEHATGTSDEVPNARSGATIGTAVFDDGNGSPGDHLVLSYQRNLAADDVLYEVQASTGLQPAGWNSGPGFVEFVSMSNNGDGTATVTYRSTRPYLSVPHEFLRLKVRARP